MKTKDDRIRRPAICRLHFYQSVIPACKTDGTFARRCKFSSPGLPNRGKSGLIVAWPPAASSGARAPPRVLSRAASTKKKNSLYGSVLAIMQSRFRKSTKEMLLFNQLLQINLPESTFQNHPIQFPDFSILVLNLTTNKTEQIVL